MTPNKQNKQNKRRNGKSKLGPGNARLLPGDMQVKMTQIMRNLPMASYTLQQNVVLGNVVSGASIPVYGAFFVTLNMLQAAATLKLIFDRYRILKASFWFIPVGVTESTSSSVITNFLHTAVDFDDATVPVSVDEVRRFSTYCGVSSRTPLQRVFAPRVAIATYISAIATGYAEGQSGTWIDCANGDIPHYGVKFALGPTTPAGVAQYEIHTAITVELSGGR